MTLPIYTVINIDMNVQVKIALTDDRGEAFCGPGLLQLIEGIGRTGSIHQASLEMKLSYVKALKILNRLETALGRPVLVRHKGGAGRGHSTLTPFARRFVRDFTALRRTIQHGAQQSSRSFVKQYEKETP